MCRSRRQVLRGATAEEVFREGRRKQYALVTAPNADPLLVNVESGVIGGCLRTQPVWLALWRRDGIRKDPAVASYPGRYNGGGCS